LTNKTTSNQEKEDNTKKQQVKQLDNEKNHYIVNPKLRNSNEVKMETIGLCHWYGEKQVLSDITFPIFKNKVTAIIGPSGCGKSTYLRDLNRMNDLIPISRVEGQVLLDEEDIYSDNIDVTILRKRIGMVFQKPNPFPMSIAKNIVFGPQLQHVKKQEFPSIVEYCLRKAVLWDEVSQRLNDNALSLSGGQQQRLCIARALSVEPDILLFDEPCSALDPHATAKIEDLITNLKKEYTVVIVTHNMQQAARVSDFTAFFNLGELIEFNTTRKIFESPERTMTEEYISGRFG
jgi:phosphate transport system ATP-binding protein